jgi:hypothetical protein
MTRQSGPTINEDHLRQGSPANSTFAETMPRLLAGTDNAIGGTGVAHATAVPLQAGDVVSNITFIVGGTAAGTPTAGFVALYSSAATPALLGQSADLGTTARAANTAYTVPLASAVTITTPGLYYVVISFAATTVPTLRGATVSNAVVAGAIGLSAKVLAQTSGSSLTGTAAATLASPTTVATPCYFALT